MKNNLTEQLILQNPLSQNPGPDYADDDMVNPGFDDDGGPGIGPDEVPPGGLDPAAPETLPSDPDMDDDSVLDRPI
jgi:hypothetical protein